jgi:hypothetical protein
VVLGLAEASSSEATTGKGAYHKNFMGVVEMVVLSPTCVYPGLHDSQDTFQRYISTDAGQQMQKQAILESEKTKAVLWDVEALANKW